MRNKNRIELLVMVVATIVMIVGCNQISGLNDLEFREEDVGKDGGEDEGTGTDTGTGIEFRDEDGDTSTDTGTGTDIKECEEGFARETTEGECKNIDECAEGTADCDKAHGGCSDEAGSYTCTCPESGWVLDKDGHTCVAEDCANKDGETCGSDDLECTEDVCRAGKCEHELQTGNCIIEGECYKENADQPGNECRYCKTGESKETWSDKPSGASCGDPTENACNKPDSCDGSGTCIPNQTAGVPCGPTCCSVGSGCSTTSTCCTKQTCTSGGDIYQKDGCGRELNCGPWVEIAGTGGTPYQMGSADGIGGADEEPKHPVNIGSFDMWETEVTVKQYKDCVESSTDPCSVPSTADSCAPDTAYGNWKSPDYDNHPVNCVSWSQAAAFCDWAGGRLPSESEWEYAARSGEQDWGYPWGDDTPTSSPCDYAVMMGCNSTSRTSEVCSKPKYNNLCDMSGNVLEWVQDIYHGSYNCGEDSDAYNCGSGGVAPSNGTAWEGSGSSRVLRGGSFGNGAYSLRSANRSDFDQSVQYTYLGFRCARSK